MLDGLPDMPVASPVGAVLVALEAKACMTAHVKSLPRLYDELNSSHLCVHGASGPGSFAIAYVQVNQARDVHLSNHHPSKDIARRPGPRDLGPQATCRHSAGA